MTDTLKGCGITADLDADGDGKYISDFRVTDTPEFIESILIQPPAVRRAIGMALCKQADFETALDFHLKLKDTLCDNA